MTKTMIAIGVAPIMAMLVLLVENGWRHHCKLFANLVCYSSQYLRVLVFFLGFHSAFGRLRQAQQTELSQQDRLKLAD